MKKICVILTITMLMTFLPAAVSGEAVYQPYSLLDLVNCGDVNCMVRDDGTMYVYSLNNNKDIYIPAEFDGIPITGIIRPSQNFGWELESITADENSEYLSSEDGVLFNKDKTKLIKYPAKKVGKTYKVPDSVTEIEAFAFRLSYLERIELPDSVEKINYFAFSECHSLKEINIPDGITELESSLFNCCTSLENITLPKELRVINHLVFKGCTSLESLTLPSKVREFNPQAVSGCTNLKEIKVEPGNMAYKAKNNMLLMHSNELVRYFCGSEEESFVIPEGITKIGNYAFESSVNLKSVEIPDSVLRIGDYAFGGCTNLEALTLPESVRYLGSLSESLKNFGSLVYNCNSLKFLNIKTKISQLTENYYEGAPNLECICLPETLTELPWRFFKENRHLKDIYFAGTQFQWENRVKRSKECPDSVTVHYNATDVTYIPSPEQTEAPTPTPAPTPVPSAAPAPAATPLCTLKYTMSVSADIPEAASEGDIIPVDVIIDTTSGIRGIQFVLNYDKEAFSINTQKDAYINSEWKAAFNNLSDYSVPKNYMFTAINGKIAALEYVDGGIDISEARALSNASLMCVDLIVKDAKKARDTEITLSEIKVSSTLTNNVKCKTVNSQNNVSLFSVTSIEDTENENAVSVSNLTENSFTVNTDTTRTSEGTVLVCVYDENGKMTELKRIPVSESTDVTLENKGLVKIMWLDSLTNLCPQNKVFDFEF